MLKLHEEAFTYIRQFQLLEEQSNVLVACSGGVDSMVLLHYLEMNAALFKLKKIAVVHVNHMLRGEESLEDAVFVKTYCAQRGLAFFEKHIPISTFVEKEKGNVEAICRRERYAFFEEVMTAHDFDYLALAHHGDDQIENVLMALTKGLHQQGILGMPNRRPFANGYLIRPFLSASRQHIEQYAKAHDVSYREDHTNNEDNYVRNRIRHHVVPLLKAENPNMVEAVQHFSEEKRIDEQFLQQIAKQRFLEMIRNSQSGVYEMNLIHFRQQPHALQRRIIQLLLNYLYKDMAIVQSYTLLKNMQTFMLATDGNQSLMLPKGVRAIRQYDQLIVKLKDVEERISYSKILIPMNTWVDLPLHMQLYITSDLTKHFADCRIYYAQQQKIGTSFHVRTRKDGDRLVVKGMTHAKKVSRILIDAKVPKEAREVWPILLNDAEEILALPGMRMGQFFSTTKRSDDDIAIIVHMKAL